MEDGLRALAEARGGLLTAVEAARLELPVARLSRMRSAGGLVRLRRGAYVPTALWAGSDESQRYALRVRAVLRTRPGVAASHHAALAVLGVPVDGLPLDRVDVLDTTGSALRVRTRRGVVLHPQRGGGVGSGGVGSGGVGSGGVRIGVDGLGDPHVAVVDALTGLARDVGPVDFAIALEQVLRCGLAPAAQVRGALGRGGGRARWQRRAMALLDTADPRSPCGAATRLRLLVTELGFRPRVRAPLHDVDGFVTEAELLIGSAIAVVRTAYPPAVRHRLRHACVAVAVVPDGDAGDPERVATALAAAMRELEGLRRARSRA